MPSYELQFLVALLVTLIIEVPVLFLVLRYLFHDTRTPLTDIVSTGIITTALTLPYLRFVVPAFVHGISYYAAGEGGVLLAEALMMEWLFRQDFYHALIASTLANGCSFGIGLTLAWADPLLLG